ncbi:MAG: S8 family serine peptidase, partial [Atopobiaceae bacterium]|nr:S8 family serine peptidase [Atopobiaceae bacterium]
GAKLIGVRVADDEGSQTSASGIRAFSFLIKCAKEINLKVANCSWSSSSAEFSFTLLANQLGREGAVTVFAAGNEHKDTGQGLDTSSFTQSPYVLAIGAINPAGRMAGFSNYSATSVDVCTPGAQILSTVPATVGGKSNRSFMPAAADEEGVVALHKFADGQSDGVQIYATNPLAEGAGPLESATVSDACGEDDAFSLAAPVAEVAAADEGRAILSNALGYNSSFYIAAPIPEERKDEPISYISARFSASMSQYDATLALDQIKLGLMGVVVQKADGTTRLADMRDDESPYTATVDTRAGAFSWLCSSLQVSHMLQEGERVYRDEQGRVLIEVGITSTPSYDTLYVDDVAIGGANAKAGAYAYMHGTSMATPAAAGALAVLAKDEPANAEASDAGVLALERVARLRASALWSDALDGVCATGGYVRLDSPDAQRLAPIITSATVGGGGHSLLVEGHFLGTEGAVRVDGADVQVSARDDATMAVLLPQDISNGAHVLSVSTAGGMDKYAFTTSNVQSQLKQYERELAAPDLLGSDAAAGEQGAGATGGGLVASGNYIYTLGLRTDLAAFCMWQYDIANDSWKNCGPLPVQNYEPYGTVLAASDTGVYLYVSMTNEGGGSKNATSAQADEEPTSDAEEETTTTINDLYVYDAAEDAWAKVETGCQLPDAANVFSHDGDLYFVGGTINGKSVYLSAYRTKSKQIETLDALPEEVDSLIIYTPKAVAFGGSYIYGAGVRGNSLMRLHLNDEGKLDKVDNLTDSLVGKVTKSGRADAFSVPAVAATSENGFVVGTELDATDTYLLPQSEDTLQPVDYTSSYYRSNAQSATWHDGVLYVLGYSPSEQSRVFFRAHSWPVDQPGDKDPEPEATPEQTPTPEPTPGQTPEPGAAASGSTPTPASQGQVGTSNSTAPAQAIRTTTRTGTPSTADTLPSWELLALVGSAALCMSAALTRKSRLYRQSNR